MTVALAATVIADMLAVQLLLCLMGLPPPPRLLLLLQLLVDTDAGWYLVVHG